MGHRSGIKKNKRGMPCHPDEIRSKIQAIQLVITLQDFIFGTVDKNGSRNADLSAAQVTAILGLLRKCLPDLVSTAITADLNVRYVAELPKMLTREEWVAKYGTNHLDLTVLPPASAGAGSIAERSGNGSVQ